VGRDKADRVDEVIAQFRAGRAKARKAPALGELTESIFAKFGGVDEFAAQLWETYQNSKTNQMVKAKILDLILVLAKEHSRQNKGAERPPLDLLQEGDLNDMAKGVLIRMAREDAEFRAELAALVAEKTVGEVQQPPPGDQG
jgi:hypothetical protein